MLGQVSHAVLADYVSQTEPGIQAAADLPEQPHQWLNGELELKAASLGHVQVVGLVDDPEELNALRKGDEDTYDTVIGHWPLSGCWSPAAWLARASVHRFITGARHPGPRHAIAVDPDHRGCCDVASQG